MKTLKKIKLDMWTNAIMTVLIGVLFIIKPHDSLKVIAIIAGILILCSGIFDLVCDSKLRRNTYFTKTSHTQNGLRTLKIQYFS